MTAVMSLCGRCSVFLFISPILAINKQAGGLYGTIHNIRIHHEGGIHPHDGFLYYELSETGSTLARTNLSPFARCTLGLNRHLY